MDPTALVMEQLAGEWAVFIATFSVLAVKGTVILAVVLAVVAVLASLPVANRRPQPDDDDGAACLRPAATSKRRPTHLRLVVPS